MEGDQRGRNEDEDHSCTQGGSPHPASACAARQMLPRVYSTRLFEPGLFPEGAVCSCRVLWLPRSRRGSVPGERGEIYRIAVLLVHSSAAAHAMTVLRAQVRSTVRHETRRSDRHKIATAPDHPLDHSRRQGKGKPVGLRLCCASGRIASVTLAGGGSSGGFTRLVTGVLGERASKAVRNISRCSRDASSGKALALQCTDPRLSARWAGGGRGNDAIKELG